MYGKQINKYMVLYWRISSPNLPSTPRGRRCSFRFRVEGAASPSSPSRGTRWSGGWIPSLRCHSRSSKLDTVLEHNMIFTISFSHGFLFHLLPQHFSIFEPMFCFRTGHVPSNRSCNAQFLKS